MELIWRGKSYEYTPRTYTARQDSEIRSVNADGSIYGADTESAQIGHAYRPISVQVAGTDGSRLFWLPDGCFPLAELIALFVGLYGEQELGKTCFMFFHNLTYDAGQLFKNRDDLIALLRTGVGMAEDYEILDNGSYKIILEKNGLFCGNAPFFGIRIQWTKKKKIRILFRDTASYFPGTLDRLGKDLKLTALKLARPRGIGKIDFRKCDPKRHRRMLASFRAYGERDAETTRQAAERIRDLHTAAGMHRIRVSAPSFAIAYLYHTMPEGDQISSGCNDQDVMQIIMNAYAGGRTGGIYHGPVSDLTVYDIHSSYPASMTTLPSFSVRMSYADIDPSDYSIPEIMDICDTNHCFLVISGLETNQRYPTLIHSVDGKLTPVYGEFHEIATTGIEAFVGYHAGSLHITKVHRLIVLIEGDEEPILYFKHYAESAYTRKANAEKGSIEYASAKLVLNASYGKLIEARNQVYIQSDASGVSVPYRRNKPDEYANQYYQEYIRFLADEPDGDFREFIDELATAIAATIPEDETEFAYFGDLGLLKLQYGHWVIPAAAALITATSRARLLVAMLALSAIYWDTDSVFVQGITEEQARHRLLNCIHLLPSYAQEVRIGDALGELEAEIEHASGWLAGVKRYWLQNETYIKKASHGLPTIQGKDLETALRVLATGSQSAFEYMGRNRPATAKQAKTSDELGSFSSAKYKSRFELDTRLTWTETETGGWIGSVKPLSDQGNNACTSVES